VATSKYQLWKALAAPPREGQSFARAGAVHPVCWSRLYADEQRRLAEGLPQPPKEAPGIAAGRTWVVTEKGVTEVGAAESLENPF